jgi:hypothetical protein
MEILDTMKQIASGLQQQRNTSKPQRGAFTHCDFANTGLVLYFLKTQAWKLTDFGLAFEGNSQCIHNTELARVTPGYCAPELLLEDRCAYNNKVDI